MPVVRPGCGTSRVLRRQYAGHQYWTARTTELGSVEGQWVVQQGGGDRWRVHVALAGVLTAPHTHPHVPHRHCIFTAFPPPWRGNESLPALPPQILRVSTVEENKVEVSQRRSASTSTRPDLPTTLSDPSAVT